MRAFASVLDVAVTPSSGTAASAEAPCGDAWSSPCGTALHAIPRRPPTTQKEANALTYSPFVQRVCRKRFHRNAGDSGIRRGWWAPDFVRPGGLFIHRGIFTTL